MLNRLKEHIESKNLFSDNDQLLLAVSGGVDSMVLAHLLSDLGYVYAVAHVDHNTRSGGSQKDKEFVNKYFESRGISVHNHLFQHDGKGNFHDQAHLSRYSFFRSLAYDKIVTAHHKDDHLETIMVNFFNGRSTEGIRSGEEVKRPLLIFSKQELMAYAKQYDIPFRTDKSNSENHYLRNFVRNKLIPFIDAKYDIEQKLTSLSHRNTLDSELLGQMVRREVSSVEVNGVVKYNLSDLKNQGSTFLFHLLFSYGLNRSQAENLVQILDKVGKEMETHNYRILVDREELLIVKKDEEQRNVDVTLQDFPFNITFGTYILNFDLATDLPKKHGSDRAYFPLSKLENRLTIRSWKAGDYMYPFGMSGKKKKLKKLFQESKIDRITKNKLPIILNNDDIIWVATLRSDHRYLVDDSEGNLLEVTISS